MLYICSTTNTTNFMAGSVHLAEAKATAVPIHIIMHKAGWTQEATFVRHHNKAIIPDANPFIEAVLDFGLF